MITEEQAKRKRCCGPWPCGIPDDFNGVQSVQRLCVASDCMAWRGEVLKANVYHTKDGEFTTLGAHMKLEDVTVSVAIKSWGYCGLAGKP